MYNKRFYGVSPRTIGGMIEDMFQNGWGRFNEEVNTMSVPVNIQETDKGYDLQVIAPGLKKEDIKVSVDKNILNISYDHKDENKEQEGSKWLRYEHRTRSFKRSFTLNEKIDASHINAKYADGILYLILPKKEPAEQQAQEISVE